MAVVEIVRPEFLPPKLVVSYLLAAAHGIVHKAVMNEPVLRKPIAHGLSGPIAVQGSILEMPIGHLIMGGGGLMLVCQLMVTRGMDGMLRVVCKMLRMTRRRVVRMQTTSGMGTKVVVRSSAETASAKAVASMTSPEAVPSAKPVTAAGTRFSDACTCYRYEDRRACRDNVFRPLHGSVPSLVSQLRGDALREELKLVSLRK